jgi:hypothetical protein
MLGIKSRFEGHQNPEKSCNRHFLLRFVKNHGGGKAQKSPQALQPAGFMVLVGGAGFEPATPAV